jgi:hypothetical protein
MARSPIRVDHKLIREVVKHFGKLEENPTYDDDDEDCERKKVGNDWECVSKAGKKCKKGKCVFISITVTVDGKKKTVIYCTCSDL